jgi:hypothetical protein
MTSTMSTFHMATLLLADFQDALRHASPAAWPTSPDLCERAMHLWVEGEELVLGAASRDRGTFVTIAVEAGDCAPFAVLAQRLQLLSAECRGHWIELAPGATADGRIERLGCQTFGGDDAHRSPGYLGFALPTVGQWTALRSWLRRVRAGDPMVIDPGDALAALASAESQHPHPSAALHVGNGYASLVQTLVGEDGRDHASWHTLCLADPHIAASVVVPRAQLTDALQACGSGTRLSVCPGLFVLQASPNPRMHCIHAIRAANHSGAMWCEEEES